VGSFRGGNLLDGEGQEVHREGGGGQDKGCGGRSRGNCARRPLEKKRLSYKREQEKIPNLARGALIQKTVIRCQKPERLENRTIIHERKEDEE